MKISSSTSPSICLLCRSRLLHRQNQFHRGGWSSTRHQTRSFPSTTSYSPRLLNRPHSVRHYTLPPNAPRPHPDIKHILRNPALYAQNARDRNYIDASTYPDRITDLRAKKQSLQNDAVTIRARASTLQKTVQALNLQRRKGGLSKEEERQLDVDLPELIEQAGEAQRTFSKFKKEEDKLEDEVVELALKMPNLSSVYSPVGDDPRVQKIMGQNNLSALMKLASEGKATSHVDIGTRLGILDFASAATTSGWGWYFLKGQGALLEHALVQYALQESVKHGWTPVSPPSITYAHIAGACGFQPRDKNEETQIYSLQQSDKDADSNKPPLCLTGTAEVPLAGMHANRILDESAFPLKSVAVSRCYRAEAGARGIDTKGLYRVHEFTKVELFAWTKPDEFPEGGTPSLSSSMPYPESDQVFDDALALQRRIHNSLLVKDLAIPLQVLEMPTRDLGASARRKVDMEAFFASRFTGHPNRDDGSGWGELTSASQCTDYQARRLNVRMRTKEGKLVWPWSMNATALAVPRVVMAVLEGGWERTETASLQLPSCLKDYVAENGVIRKCKF